MLGTRYCTITLGGPLLGVVGTLEARGRSTYLGVVRTVLDQIEFQPKEVILEVGGGSGVVPVSYTHLTLPTTPYV